ncbi:hypothetical protein [Dyella sp. ASV21]|uniref:hypothetical protein n=1 Tax=Dyella sp. ASV21 TaxID=2795114 RepID=UPI001E5397AA|nr:hypothetical protein [Dyella sp. ASV21]
MRLLSRAVLAISIATAASTALADAPATGLGQEWPNAPDVSAHPNFHVYVFALGGIDYIQVNDASGDVLGGVGTSGGQFITLPIGRYAQQVTTPDQPAASPSNAAAMAAPASVYNDNDTVITATPMSDGTLQLRAGPQRLGCGDPVDCNMKAL